MNVIPVVHLCPKGGIVMNPDDAGRPFERASRDKVTCGSCARSWCEACQPTPAALCPWCNGAGVQEGARMSIDLDDEADVQQYLNGGSAA